MKNPTKKQIQRRQIALSLWGSIGGKKATRAKILAARKNGKKGGRPKGSTKK